MLDGGAEVVALLLRLRELLLGLVGAAAHIAASSQHVVVTKYAEIFAV